MAGLRTKIRKESLLKDQCGVTHTTTRCGVAAALAALSVAWQPYKRAATPGTLFARGAQLLQQSSLLLTMSAEDDSSGVEFRAYKLGR